MQKFEKIANDLQDCFYNWNEKEYKNLSPKEQQGKHRILTLCKLICEKYHENLGEE